ncbi:MAG: hypothetical protein G01um101466_385 [Parcubacteria group bacterium Gr01-1014_66]|nr:MAG: hypothetical protein G01um101466_385 [Parcubacteria group bacterium Gr01-1014_66]
MRQILFIGFACAALFLPLLPTPVAYADGINNASCFGISAPSSVLTGQLFSASIGMTNTGNSMWTNDGTPHRLVSQNPQDNTRWGIARLNISSNIAPGESAVFTGSFVAPSTPSTYSFDWRMIEESVESFGQTCTATIVVNPSSQPQGNLPSASTLSPSIVGQTSVTFRGTVNPNNAPTNAWFEYGASPSLGGLVGAQSIGSSGSTVNFSFFFDQLQQNTTYYYRAVAQNSFGTARGDLVTFNTGSIAGNNNASCMSVDIPSSIARGHTFTARVTVRNTGGNTWNSFDGTPHRLVSQNPQDNTRWGIARVDLPTTVSPGNTATFQFNATAPSAQGTYAFDWRMLEEPFELFGETCTRSIFVSDQGFNFAPAVTTFSATAISQNSVLFQSGVNPQGSHTTAWFEYGLTPSLGTTVGHQSVGSGTSQTNVSFALSGLAPNTSYYYRAVAENASGRTQGSILNFTTQGGFFGSNVPIVTTNSTLSINQTNATLQATVNPNNSATSAWFEYGITPSLGSIIGFQSVGSGFSQINVTHQLFGLQPNTLYYYRIAAQNQFGTSRGSVFSFTTHQGTGIPGGGPGVITRPVAGVFRNAALVKGSVNPNGSFTNSWFEWGGTASLGSNTASQSVGNGTTLLDFSFALSHLQPNTTYYWRAVAQNPQGTQRGEIRSFTTLPVASVATPPAPPRSPTPPPPQIIPGPTSSLVTITPSIDKNNPEPGESVALTFTYRNENTVPLQDVALKITLPAEVTYQASNIIPSSQNANQITFMLGSIPQRSQGAVTMHAKVKEDVSQTSTLVFNVTLESGIPGQQIQPVGSFLAVTTKEKAKGADLAGIITPGEWRTWISIFFFLILILIVLYLFVRLMQERKIRISVEQQIRRPPPPSGL